jgi:hypothetical protein
VDRAFQTGEPAFTADVRAYDAAFIVQARAQLQGAGARS